MEKTKVLIADDDQSILWVLERFLGELGLEAVKAEDGPGAERLIKAPGVKVALLDINMPGADGLKILKDSRGAGSPVEVIIMTADSTMQNTLEAMKHGAFDYVTKPFDLNELEITIQRALKSVGLRERVSALSERLTERLKGETVFIGKSKAVEKVFKTIGRAAPKDVTMLVLGESGTGKELLARLIHLNSPRKDGPFVAMNSAAVPRELMESELFGYEKGAFTGAVEGRPGKFELADGGTLFLDEVGDMDPGLQARLLRVTQESEFYRVGGKAPVRVDARIIAATNQDIEKAVEEKRFREDLYYRLNGVTVTLPPLRERRGDVALLAGYFTERFCREFGSEPRTLSPKALEALEEYDWPGNVRELENALRRAVILSRGPVLTPEDLDLPRARKKSDSIEDIITARLRPFFDKTDLRVSQELYDLIMPYMERPLITLVLEKTRGNQVQAAEVLGINRNTLRKKIKTLKINMKKIKD